MIGKVVRSFRQRPEDRRIPRRRCQVPCLEPLEDRTLPATLTVNTLADNDVRDDVLSLREAILVANGTLSRAALTAREQAQVSGALTSPAPDTIAFSIPGAGARTIQLGSALPIITDPVILDGYTQPGSAPATSTADATLRIILDGSQVASGDGIAISAGKSVVRGLVIHSVGLGAEIALLTAGDNRVEGNYLGTDATGTQALPSRFGVWIGSAGNTVGGNSPDDRNVIAAGWLRAVEIAGSGNFIQGNYVGTDRTGTVALNSGDGVFLDGAQDNLIGGAGPGEGNLISGNTNRGVSLSWGSSNNRVLGNLIGTDRTGTVAVGNGSGVFVNGSNNRIGGPNAGEGNVISGNGSGVHLEGLNSSTGNRVQGNLIGTDKNGTAPLPNRYYGVSIYGGISPANAANNLIGGLSAAEGNVIAYNGDAGILIGMTAPLPGYPVTGHTGNAILSNRIFGNGGLGIDLTRDTDAQSDGATANDPQDGDSGPNSLQNYPVLSTASYANGQLTVQGTLNSTPSIFTPLLLRNTYLLQFFASRSADGSGYGEGEQLLGAITVQTDGLGNASFNVTFNAPVPVGAYLTATATRMVDHDNSFLTPRVPRDTSEFAQTLKFLGSISGRKYEDTNANGVRDAGEPGRAGWTIFLDANGNGALDAGEPSTVTDASGNYTFGNLNSGTYTVREVMQVGWFQSAPAGGSYTVSLATGQDAGNRDFGNYRLGSISGRKYEDTNGNGVRNAGEPGLAGWTIFLDANGNGALDAGELSTVTDAAGNYQFDKLRPGTYTVAEVMQAGWRQSAPQAGVHTVAVQSGQNASNRDFGNYRPGALRGQAFYDYDADGFRDAGEPGMPNWRIYLDANNDGVHNPGEAVVVTDPQGFYTFINLRPGTHRVRESPRPGFLLTTPAGGVHTVSLSSNQQVAGLDFGNADRDPRLILTITPLTFAENAGAQAATATVTRSGRNTSLALTVTLTSGDVSEARVPMTITIPANQATSAVFFVQAMDDLIQDGTQTVTITASAAGFVNGLATVRVTDNEALAVGRAAFDQEAAALDGIIADWLRTEKRDRDRVNVSDAQV